MAQCPHCLHALTDAEVRAMYTARRRIAPAEKKEIAMRVIGKARATSTRGRLNDLRGRHFGTFVVEKRSETKHSSTVWVLVCQICQTTIERKASDLIAGKLPRCPDWRAHKYTEEQNDDIHH